ncbi:MAG: hypothetical protein WCP85_19930 [Mariniphaga sp.]
MKHSTDETFGGVGGNVIPDDKKLITEYLDYIGVWRSYFANNGTSTIS